MRPIVLWIINVLMLIGQLILEYKVIRIADYSQEDGWVFFIIFIVVDVLILLGFGLAIGVMLALIPIKEKEFSQKFRFTFPIATSLTLVILLISFGYIAYLNKVKGIELKPLVKYDKIEIPQGLDCSSVKYGIFETESFAIKRQGNKQIEILKRNNQKSEYNIEWLSDCEYILSPIDNPSKKLKVKIINVTKDGYECYSSFDKYANRFTLKRTSVDN